ncbi:putative metal-binding motif-containing protein [Candidatus Uhrbacteria bacterium]|nr:putative metal-binding motif-containing protein [Candidatus Uhrbacteria bacterium]
MNRTTTTSFVFAVLAAFALTACGGVQADWDQPDGTSADAGAKPDSESSGGEVSTTATCNPAIQDCDGDGRIGQADCGPYDPSVYAGAPELCDGKDNNCDGHTDEGCPAKPAAAADSDGDGYPDGPQDCAPSNPSVHPGATEICDGVDNNCDGVTDEGCSAATIPPGNEAKLSCTFTFTTDRQRTVNVQAYDTKADLGKWWDSSQTGSGKSITVELPQVPKDICGFRLNTAEGNPPTDWFCEGNGSTANLDPSTSVSCVFDGKSATKSGLKTWSAPGGTNAGCSAVWVVTPSANCW